MYERQPGDPGQYKMRIDLAQQRKMQAGEGFAGTVRTYGADIDNNVCKSGVYGWREVAA